MHFFTKSMPAVTSFQTRRLEVVTYQALTKQAKKGSYNSSRNLLGLLNVGQCCFHCEFTALWRLEHVWSLHHHDIGNNLPSPSRAFPEDISC